MTKAKRAILGVFAHPDDESMGPGGTFAKYAALGHRVSFITATEGGAGRLHRERPVREEDRAKLRAIRRRETFEAASILGIESLGFLDWEDGQLSSRNILEIEEIFAALFRREKPDVVVTFHPSGISYHSDHRVITLAVMGAFLGARETSWYKGGGVAELPPHQPAKLYAYVPDREAPFWRDWPRQVYAASRDEITTVIDTRTTSDTKWRAIAAHASQQDGPPFRKLYEAGGFLEENFVRIFPSHPGGDPKESDLLEGLD
jgi:LmbE family N-acetylglucosaminyl deacetylase